MSNKFVEIVKEKMAEIRKQREQDKSGPAPDFTFERKPQAQRESEKPVKH